MAVLHAQSKAAASLGCLALEERKLVHCSGSSMSRSQQVAAKPHRTWSAALARIACSQQRGAAGCNAVQHLQAPGQEDLEQGSAGRSGHKASATGDPHDPNARSAVQHTPKLADEALQQQPASPQQLPACQQCRRGASLVQQLHILFWRTLTDVVRNPALLLMHCALSVVMGIFCGLIFMNLGIGIAGTQNRAGGLQLWCVLLHLHDLPTHGALLAPRVVQVGFSAAPATSSFKTQPV